MKISVTGHRPNKLWGYDIQNTEWRKLKEILKGLLVTNGCDEAITGMDLGVGTIFALAVLELKEEGYPIKLHCAIPCRNHSCKWIQESVDLYNSILVKADKVVLVTDEEYEPWLMQKRNEYMVDLAAMVIAVWDGSTGGTGNCVKYAAKCGKEIVVIKPDKVIDARLSLGESSACEAYDSVTANCALSNALCDGCYKKSIEFGIHQ